VRDSEVTDPTTHEQRPISGLRPYEGQVDFTQDFPRRKMQWGLSAFLGFTQRYYRFDQVETDTFYPIYSVFVEWKPQPDLDLKAQIDHIGTEYNRRLTVVNGVLGVDPIAYAEQRPLHLGPYFTLRMRKSF
jgi:hypothetical protein